MATDRLEVMTPVFDGLLHRPHQRIQLSDSAQSIPQPATFGTRGTEADRDSPGNAPVLRLFESFQVSVRRLPHGLHPRKSERGGTCGRMKI
jgi:hypothetical protein